MTGTVMEIRSNKSESQRKFRLDKGLRDAVSDQLRARWPSGTAKNAAREYNISLDRAREAVAGRASVTTIEAIIKRGGPSFFLPILEEVWGQSIARYFIELRETHEQHAGRLAALTADIWPVRGSSADPPPRVGRPEAERRQSSSR